MRYLKNNKKGNTLVEFIVIIPAIIFFLFATWSIYELSMTRISFLKASRYMAWEKADYTGGKQGKDYRASANIYADAKAIYKLDDKASLSLQNTSSLKSSDFDIPGVNVILSAMSKIINGAIYLSVVNLGLETNGLWNAAISQDVPMPGKMLNNIIPGGDPIPDKVTISEKCLLLTDSWNAVNAPDNTSEGISFGATRERLSGYWLLGPLDFTQGNISGLVTDILEYEIDLKWLGKYPLCAEKPPRVNMQSVPNRSKKK